MESIDKSKFWKHLQAIWEVESEYNSSQNPWSSLTNIQNANKKESGEKKYNQRIFELQKHTEELVGRTLTIKATVRQIDEKKIEVEVDYALTIRKPTFFNEGESTSAKLVFTYDESLKKTLLTINIGDTVRIEGKLLFINSKRLCPSLQLTAIEKKSGCFVATVCYGNHNAPEVLLLRQFRDEKLLTNTFGKTFVSFYYFVSPKIANAISKSDRLKYFFRQFILQPIVRKLE
jgi:hypothetical protein